MTPPPPRAARRAPIASTHTRRARLRVEELESRTVLSASGPSQVSLLGAVTPNDQYFSRLYGMDKVDAPEAWVETTGSRSVVVAVIDSGVDYTHPDLYQNVW